MTRLYKKGSIDSSESEEDPDETDNSNFEETLYKSVAEAVGIVKRQQSDHDGYKSLSREFAWYLETGKKSTSLECLYQALVTISRTSVGQKFSKAPSV